MGIGLSLAPRLPPPAPSSGSSHLIDPMNEIDEPAIVLAVEIQDQPRQLEQFWFIDFLGERCALADRPGT